MCGLLYMFCMQFLVFLFSIAWYIGALTHDLVSFLMLVFGMMNTSSDDLPLWGMHLTHFVLLYLA